MTAYAPAAHSKSAIAPFTSGSALAGVSSPPTGMFVGLLTSRALSKRSHPVAARTTTARSAMYLMGRLSSVSQVDGDDPLRELRQIGLLPGAEVASAGPAEEHGFGFQATVARPRVQISSGERYGGVGRADGARPALGQRV